MSSAADAGAIKATIEGDLSGLEKAINRAMARATKKIDSSMDQAMDRVETRVSSGFKKVGGLILGALSIDVIGQKIMQAGTYIATLGAKTEATLNTFQAVSKATGDEMERVSDLATELGKDISLPGTSAATAAEAMTELAKSGLSVEESMDAAKGTLQLAAAAQVEAAEAARIQGSALNAFRLGADQAARVSDVLANSANASAAEVTDTADALAQAGAVAQSAGLSIEETTTLLSQFANAGIRGSDAGTLLKTMLLQLQAPTKKARGLMEELGFSVFDANGEMVSARQITARLIEATKGLTEEKKAEALAVLFGADAVRGANVLIEQGIKVHDKVAQAIGRHGAAAEVAAAKSKGLTGAISAAKSVIESLAVEIYQNAAPAVNEWLRGGLDRLPGILDEAGTYLTRLWQAAEPARRIVGALVSAMKPGAVAAFKGALGAVLGVAVALSVPLEVIADVIDANREAFEAIVGPITAAYLAYKLWQKAVSVGTTFRTNAIDRYTESVAHLRNRFHGATGAVSRFRVVTGGVMGAMGGAWGLALGAATLALGYFAAKNAEAEAFVDSLTESLDQQTGALTKNTREKVVNRLESEGLLEKADELGLSLDMVTKAALGDERAMSLLADQLARTNNDFAKLDASATVPGVSTGASRARDFLAALRALAGKVDSSREALARKNRTQRTANLIAERAEHMQARLRSRVVTTNTSLNQQARASRNAKAALRSLNNESLKGINAQIDFEQASDDLRRQIKSLTKEQIKSGRALDVQTEAGRNTFRAFINLATSAKGVEGGMARARRQIFNTIRPMVDSKKEAWRLTDQFIKLEGSAKDVPNKVKTEVSAPGAHAAKRALEQVATAASRIPEAVQTHITTTQTHVMRRLERADGGPVFGPGTGTSDSIPAMLSNNEHVWTDREVRAAGGHGNVIRLRNAVLEGRIAFADGGGLLDGRKVNATSARAVKVGSGEDGGVNLSVSVGDKDDLPDALDETLFHLRRIGRGGRP